jgi:hypothetical protein
MAKVKTYVPAHLRNKYLEAKYFKSGADDSSEKRTFGATYYPHVTKDISNFRRIDYFAANFVKVLYSPGDSVMNMQNDLGLYFRDVATGEVDTRFTFDNDKFI